MLKKYDSKNMYDQKECDEGSYAGNCSVWAVPRRFL